MTKHGLAQTATQTFPASEIRRGILPDDKIQVDESTGKEMLYTDDIWEAIHHQVTRGEGPVRMLKVKDDKLRTGFRAFYFYYDTPDHRAEARNYAENDPLKLTRIRKAQQSIKQLTFDQ